LEPALDQQIAANQFSHKQQKIMYAKRSFSIERATIRQPILNANADEI